MSVSVAQLAVAGGTPVRDIKARPWPAWPIATEEDIAAVAAVLRSGKWNRWRSDRVEALEEALQDFTGAAHVIALASGTAGLEVALKAAGVRPGDEVILPAYTYIATATAVLQVGGVPVFADIIPETENVDPAAMESLITERTRALLPVHVSGLPCDMAAITAVAARHGLRVIEDTAQGIGGMWHGRRLGTLGDAGAYSFQASKNLPGGEGGAVVTNDPEIAERAFMLMHINYETLGWNYRLPAMTAALILSQLERFPALQAAGKQTPTTCAMPWRECPASSPRAWIHSSPLTACTAWACASSARSSAPTLPCLGTHLPRPCTLKAYPAPWATVIRCTSRRSFKRRTPACGTSAPSPATIPRWRTWTMPT